MRSAAGEGNADFLLPNGTFFLELVAFLLLVGAVIAILVVVVAAVRRRPSVEKRLAELEKLRDRGVITATECDARRAAILQSI